MKNSITRRILSALLITVLTLGICAITPAQQVQAAKKGTKEAPATPVFTAKIVNSGNDVKFTISKTSLADGYIIYMKGSNDESFKKIKTIAKAGTAQRTFTKRDIPEDSYSFKVRAYRVVKGKKVYSKYSKAVKLDIRSRLGEEQIYADITFKNGYAYFGRYPQKKVTNSSTVTALKSTPGLDGTSGGEYNGKWYFYSDSTKSWYCEEPIEWVILKGSPESKTVTLMSNKILLECGFSDWSGFESGGKWKDSFVRAHLNGYNGSFNNIWTMDFYRVAFPGETSRALITQEYDGCDDKVLLPSKKQLTGLTASQRVRKASEFAKKADDHGYWCINSDGKGNITLVKPNGDFTTNKAWQQDGQGYVPVIVVDLTRCNVYTE